MKKKYFLMTMALAACLMFSGCEKPGDIENEKAYRQIGINNMEEGAYEDAIIAFDKALSLSGGEIRDIEYDICFRKVEAYTAMGDTESAKELCDYLIQYDKNISTAYVLRGNLNLKSDDPELALKDFETAVAKDPKNVANYIAIYTGLSNAGYDVQAQEYVDKALQVDGSADDAQFVRSMAKLYYIRGEYDTAISYLKTMDDPDDQSCYYMGNIHMDSGAYDEAIEDYNKAIELYEKNDESEMSPSDVRGMYRNRVIAKELALDFTGAYSFMEEYVEKYPEDKDALREEIFLASRKAESEYSEDSGEDNVSHGSAGQTGDSVTTGEGQTGESETVVDGESETGTDSGTATGDDTGSNDGSTGTDSSNVVENSVIDLP